MRIVAYTLRALAGSVAERCFGEARLGMTGWARCCMLGAAAAVVLMGFGAASAPAAPVSHTPRAMLAAHGFPWTPHAPQAFDLPEASLTTDPVKVTIGSVVYTMSIAVGQDLSTPGSEPQLDINLDRQAAGTQIADQNHDYFFTPASGLTFTYDTTAGAKATVKATTAIAPSALSITYTAKTTDASPCKLQDGSKGDQIFSSGTLKVSTFSFVSGTSPVFGTVTTKPKTASFFYDPGCKAGGGKLVLLCGGAEDVEAGGPAAAQEWSFANDYGDSKAFEAVFQSSSLPTEAIQDSILAQVRGADLPAPTTSATGATATVKTTGNPFESGTGTFTSTKAPKVSTGSCKDSSDTKHTYRLSTYAGRLASSSPLLTANYDTGPLTLSAPITAKLYVVNYTS